MTTHNGTVRFTYDADNQLTYETLPDGTQIRYTFDPNGNRTGRTVTKGGTTVSNTAYTYDAANQLKTVNGQPYTHDANGNLTSGGGITYVYDAGDRLTAVKNAAGATLASFTYDFNGLRMSMTSAAGTVFYHYNNAKPQRLIAETDASGNILAEYSWDSYGRPATMTRNGYTYYYHHNGHGDVIMLTDSTGKSVAEYQYDAWGTITAQSGALAAANPFRFGSYQFDEATGLYYLFARYYAPTFGRFLTPDPDVKHTVTPVEANPYVYSNNDPLDFADESGKNPILVGAAIGIGYRWAATWGNHCGYKRGKKGVSCKDWADYCCYAHDRCYDTRDRQSCSCDRELISCMDRNRYRMKASEKFFASRAKVVFTAQKKWCSNKRSTVRVTSAGCNIKR